MNGQTLTLPWPQRLYRSAWIDGPSVDFYLQQLNPLWSLAECRGKVLAVDEETPDCKSFVIAPAWGWRGHKPGQHIGVSVEIKGRQVQRRYSISNGPSAKARDAFRITVKRDGQGLVSNYLNDHIQVGNILNLHPAAGDFVLPAQVPNKFLLMAAGSGITPIMSQLRALLEQGFSGDICLLHYVRSRQDRIFALELQSLADRHPQLSVQWCLEEDAYSNKPERFSVEQIQQRVPDYAERHCMLCGPAGFMAAVREHWDARDLNAQLQFEYFGPTPSLKTTTGGSQTQQKATLANSQRQIKISAGQSLLEALEAAGEQPAYGCRMGICHSCKCRKLSGEVTNQLSGERSNSPDEDIQLCISQVQSDVVLAL